MLTRRQVVFSGAAATVIRIGPRMLGGLTLFALSTSPAYASWSGWLAAAQTGLSILSSFSSTDGGLGAMMRAQMEKIELVIGQLADIQQRLISIELEFQKLEEKHKKILAENYRNSLIYGISSAASSYREMLATSTKDPGFFDSAPAQDRLRNLAQIANINRNTLALVPEGFGPETALAVPVACALEVSCSVRIGFKEEFIITILESYRDWLNSMISDRPGSVIRYYQQALDEHNAALIEGSDTRLGKIFNISQFKIDSKESPSLINIGLDYCLMFSNVVASSGASLVPRENIMVGLRSLAPMNAGATYYEHSAELRLDFVESLNCSQLEYNYISDSVSFARSRSIQGDLPKGDTCYVRQSKSIFDASTAIKFANTPAMRGDFDQELSIFISKIDRMNLARAQIAFAEKAKAIVSDTILRVEEQIKYLHA